MRSSLSLPARLPRRGLGAVAVALLTLTTGCSFITGVPDVDYVRVTLAPDSLPALSTGTASGAAYHKDNVVTSSRIVLGFSSSNPTVATVNSTTGQITALAPGKTDIAVAWHGKSDSKTLVVTDPLVADIQITPAAPSVEIGKPLKLGIVALNSLGKPMGTRQVTVSAANPSLVSITGDGTTANTTITGVAPGSTSLSVTVGNRTQTVPLTVTLTQIGSIDIQLPKGGSTVLVGETSALVVTMKDVNGQVISSVGRGLACQSSDETILSVTLSTCVVTGRKAGSATITAVTEGNVRKTLAITVQEVPATALLFPNPNPVFRKGAVRNGGAVAVDSAGNQLNRTASYTVSNPRVLSITSSGIVTPLDTGTATITARLDNLTATLNARVTLPPIIGVTVTPNAVQRQRGDAVQFGATVFDSLNSIVTDRKVSWLSSAPNVAAVNAQTGLATAIGTGTTTIIAQIERVPGEGFFVPGQASFVVLPPVVDTIIVTPPSVTVRVGASAFYSLVARDAAGNTIVNPTVNGQSDNPAVAILGGVPGQASVTGIAPGTTTISFQAYDPATGTLYGKVSRLTVVVTSQ